MLINPDSKQHEDAILACLMCRLGLDFNRWSYETREREMIHVESYMRVCLQADPSFDGIYSISPSEPILAEGARMVMQTVSFDGASILAQEYRRPEVERGLHGESIGKLLIVLATDMIAKPGKPKALEVTEFMQRLCGSPSTEGVLVCNVLDALPSCVHPDSGIALTTRFQDIFKGSKMNMNHFTKAGNSAVLDRKYGWARILRCSGLDCSDIQPAVDIIILFMYYDEALGCYNVTFILVQINNDTNYDAKPDLNLFAAMDPYILGLFSADDDDYSIGCLPIIRIVFALVSKESTVVNCSAHAADPSRPKTKKDRYTAYDFWFAGLDHHVWGPIKREEEASWKALLGASRRPIETVFELDDCDREDLRRSQAPMMLDKEKHWSEFMEMDLDVRPDMSVRGINNPKLSASQAS
jgi:hypothetical protein